MLKGYILVETDNGKTYKYVRDVIKRGDPKNYYAYGDTIGDTYNFQGDTPGKIKYDFNYMITIYKSRSEFGGKFPNTMLWPESTGDTEVLIRTNIENATLKPVGTSSGLGGGDSFFYKLLPKRRLLINTLDIVSITVVEERIAQWNQNAVVMGNLL